MERAVEGDAQPNRPRRHASKRKRQGEPRTPTTTGRRVAAALLIAGIILAVFNSGALVQYAGGLSDKAFGPTVISVSERWHGLMERGRMTRLTDQIRATVTTARHSSWQDLAKQLGLDQPNAVGEAADGGEPLNGNVSSIPGRYGDQPAKPVRRTSADQSG